MASPRAQRPRDRHHQPRPITSPRRPQTRASTAGFGERRTRLLLSAHMTMAIVEYLAATPSARAALTNLDDLVPALRALQANEPRPRVPLEPVVHSADRHRAILAALDHVWPRRFAGYPAADEARPSVEQVVDAVLARAPAWVAAESRDKLTEQIRRHLAIGSWDFTFLSIVGNS